MRRVVGSKGIPLYLKASLDRYEDAVRDHAFIGSSPPEFIEQIEENLNRTRSRLENSIYKAIESARAPK